VAYGCWVRKDLEARSLNSMVRLDISCSSAAAPFPPDDRVDDDDASNRASSRTETHPPSQSSLRIRRVMNPEGSVSVRGGRGGGGGDAGRVPSRRFPWKASRT